MSPPIDAKRKSRMRFEVYNLFWKRGTQEANLSLVAIAVWPCMWGHADKDSMVRISYSRIAKECNITVRSVTNAIAELRQKRMLKIIERGTVNGKPNACVLWPYPKEITQKKAGTA